ncbi:MAG TPA: serine/threonine-protein kinase [Kofleriaceae bacterium]
MLAPGAKAGPWVIESELGRGGMGAVYAVTHEEIGKRAALKVMHRALVSDVAAERILTEARVVNRIGHAGIVDIFETGRLGDGRLYIVMERLEGRPLGAVAMDAKLLPDRVVDILLQICDALIAAHAAGVVHRDLKLDNVFLIDNPEDPGSPKVKVLDWGIAKEVASNVRQTVDGQLVGTPQYLSPEQARGLDVGPPSDVYSFGVMAYELFLEQLPFEAETAAEVMTMHLRALPPDPRELWPEIPHLLESLILQMLAKKPVDRPSMLSVAHALGAVREELAARRGSSRVIEPIRPRLPSEPIRAYDAPRTNHLPPLDLDLEEPISHNSRAWRIAAGAAAIVAAAVMFGMAHESDATVAARSASARAALAAPISRKATRDTVPILTTPAIARPGTEAIATPVVAPIGAPIGAPVVSPAADSHLAPPAHRAPHRAAKSHAPGARHGAARDKSKLDIDGTVDPYS